MLKKFPDHNLLFTESEHLSKDEIISTVKNIVLYNKLSEETQKDLEKKTLSAAKKTKKLKI